MSAPAPAPTLADRARAGIVRAQSLTTLTAPARPAPRPDGRPGTRPAPRRPAPDLRALPTPARLHRGVRVLLLLTGMAVVVVGILGIVALNALAAEASFDARSLERDIAEMTLRHDDLVAEVAALAGPARVQQVATTSLGMMAPEVPGFLTLDPADMPAPPAKPLLAFGTTTGG